MKINIFNDNFQNYKRYNVPKAQLVIADIPYNLGNNAYASSPEWYINGYGFEIDRSFYKKSLEFYKNNRETTLFLNFLFKP